MDYRIIGRLQKGDCVIDLNRIIPANNADQVLGLVNVMFDDEWEWVGRFTLATETLYQAERRALADWNAGKPTASPLALAKARGEL